MSSDRCMKLGSGEFLGDILKFHEVPGLRMATTRYSHKRVLPVHSHQYAYFCLIRSGMYEETYGSRSRVCTKGMVAFHPAAEDHGQRMGSKAVVSFNVEMDFYWTHRTKFQGPWSASDGPVVWLANSMYREFQTPDAVCILLILREHFAYVTSIHRGDICGASGSKQRGVFSRRVLTPARSLLLAAASRIRVTLSGDPLVAAKRYPPSQHDDKSHLALTLVVPPRQGANTDGQESRAGSERTAGRFLKGYWGKGLKCRPLPQTPSPARRCKMG
jgi:hypothetical protein